MPQVLSFYTNKTSCDYGYFGSCSNPDYAKCHLMTVLSTGKVVVFRCNKFHNSFELGYKTRCWHFNWRHIVSPLFYSCLYIKLSHPLMFGKIPLSSFYIIKDFVELKTFWGKYKWKHMSFMQFLMEVSKYFLLDCCINKSIHWV